MPIIPLDVATEGYLNSPLSVATSGYIYIATVEEIDNAPSGGGTGRTRKIKGKSVADIKRQMRQNEQIVTIVLAMIEQDII